MLPPQMATAKKLPSSRTLMSQSMLAPGSNKPETSISTMNSSTATKLTTPLTLITPLLSSTPNTTSQWVKSAPKRPRLSAREALPSARSTSFPSLEETTKSSTLITRTSQLSTLAAISSSPHRRTSSSGSSPEKRPSLPNSMLRLNRSLRLRLATIPPRTSEPPNRVALANISSEYSF